MIGSFFSLISLATHKRGRLGDHLDGNSIAHEGISQKAGPLKTKVQTSLMEAFWRCLLACQGAKNVTISVKNASIKEVLGPLF